MEWSKHLSCIVRKKWEPGKPVATCATLFRHHICQIFYTSTVENLPQKKRVNRDILNLKY